MQHRIGAYIRVSTEEQAQVLEGSLDSQKHRLESFVELKNIQEGHWGKIIEVYADEGFSAKNTKRPALQKLLRDIKSHKVDLILVTDLSRLSRNILDFCLLLEDLKEYGGKFLSIKEQFDTTTAAGEMMVFNMMNLAQFERKQTAERVSQNFHSRAMRGLLNGGPVLLGYDKHPENPALYIVNESEAPIVREIYRLFLEEGSLARTAKRLNDSGTPRKLGLKRKFRLASAGFWTPQSVKNLLENKAYIGVREVNKKYKSRNQTSLKPWQQYQESKAAWPAIVSQETFEAALSALRVGRTLERPKPTHDKGSPFILTGLLKCARCGAPFVGETGHGRVSSHRYYGHKQYQGIPFQCPVRRFPAESIEEEVEKHLAAIALNPRQMESIEIAIKGNIDQELIDVRQEKDRIQQRLLEIDMETHQIFRLLGDMAASIGLDLVKEQIEKLGSEKKKLTSALIKIEDRLTAATNIKTAIKNLGERIVEFKAGWRKASLAQKKRLLRAVIERLEVNVGTLGIYYLVPSDSDHQEVKGKVKRPTFRGSSGNNNDVVFNGTGTPGNPVTATALGSYDVKIGVTDGA